MVVDQAQCEQVFATLEREQANVVYARTAVEFGVVGAPAS